MSRPFPSFGEDVGTKRMVRTMKITFKALIGHVVSSRCFEPPWLCFVFQILPRKLRKILSFTVHCFALRTSRCSNVDISSEGRTIEIFILQSVGANCIQATDCPNVNIEPCVHVLVLQFSVTVFGDNFGNYNTRQTYLRMKFILANALLRRALQCDKFCNRTNSP